MNSFSTSVEWKTLQLRECKTSGQGTGEHEVLRRREISVYNAERRLAVNHAPVYHCRNSRRGSY